MGKNNVHFVRIGSILSNSSGNPHIARKHMDKQFNLEPPKLRVYQLTTHLVANILPPISSALRDLGVNFDKCIYLEVPYWRVQIAQVLKDCAVVHKINIKIQRIMLLREISEERLLLIHIKNTKKDLKYLPIFFIN